MSFSPSGYPGTCPHPYPHGGDTLWIKTALCSPVFYRGLAASQHPRLRSVLWLARQLFWGGRARQKPPSSLTRKRVHRRTGYIFLENKCARRKAVLSLQCDSIFAIRFSALTMPPPTKSCPSRNSIRTVQVPGSGKLPPNDLNLTVTVLESRGLISSAGLKR